MHKKLDLWLVSSAARFVRLALGGILIAIAIAAAPWAALGGGIWFVLRLPGRNTLVAPRAIEPGPSLRLGL